MKLLPFKVRAFVNKQDTTTLERWWAEWKLPAFDPSELPETGFMVEFEGKPILCAFLILTNAKFALLETMCANPETSYEDREDAIKLLTNHVARVAKDFGFRRLLAFPQKERLAEKGISAGWTVHPNPCFACIKEL